MKDLLGLEMGGVPAEFLAKVAERAIGILRPDMKASAPNSPGAPGDASAAGDK